MIAKQRMPGEIAGRQLPSLTPLRGIAALWVVLYHYGSQFFPNLHPDAYTHLLDKGYLAVDLFFLLSGFVMTHVYHDALSGEPDDGYWDFLKARVARIYPLHLVVLLLFVATALLISTVDYAASGRFDDIPLTGAQSYGALLANLLLVQGVKAGELSWNYPSWSISVEFMAYLLFPFALPLLRRAGARTRLALWLGAAAVLGGLAWATGDYLNQWDGPITLLRCLPEFLLGMLLYLAFRSGSAVRLLPPRDGVVLGLLAGIAVLLHADAPDILMVPLFAALILTSVGNRGGASVWLNGAPLVWLGEISYSLYLVQGWVEYATERLLLPAAGIPDPAALSAGWSLTLMLVMVALCLALATLSHRKVEVTGRRFLRRAFDLRRGTRRRGGFSRP